MDILPEAEYEQKNVENIELNYDETVPLEEQSSIYPETDSLAEQASGTLAERIGFTKVYLIPEATGTNRARKRKYEDEEEAESELDQDSVDASIRENALLLQGSPISHLPTNNIFAYATHFDAHPIALEWLDDTTCILVFSTRAAASTARRYLSKLATDEPSEDGFVTAKSIPVALWPPEERINKSLGMGEGLKGTLRLRWATPTDVKQKGAKKQSEFYKKYGSSAGRENGSDGSDGGPMLKRRRGNVSEVVEKAVLDDELEEFLAEDQVLAPPSPPSKMRSDYIGIKGKSLLERTANMPFQVDLQSRITAPMPRRKPPRERRVRDEIEANGTGSEGGVNSAVGESGRNGKLHSGRTARPKKTAEDLDAELDAFLQEGTHRD